MHTYRVWFDDESAVVIDAPDEWTCREYVYLNIRIGNYHGNIVSIEKLN